MLAYESHRHSSFCGLQLGHKICTDTGAFACLPLLLWLLHNSRLCTCFTAYAPPFRIDVRMEFKMQEGEWSRWERQEPIMPWGGRTALRVFSYVYCSMSLAQLIGSAISGNMLPTFHLCCIHWLYRLAQAHLCHYRRGLLGKLLQVIRSTLVTSDTNSAACV